MYGRKGTKRKYSSKGRGQGRGKFRRSESYQLTQWNRAKAYSYAPRRKWAAATANFGPSGSFAADRFQTQLKWRVWITAAAAPAYRFVVRGNSVFDPGFTSGATQPNGHTALSAQYAYYRVYWSTIKVTYLNDSQSAQSPAVFAVYPSTSSNPITSGTIGNEGQAYGTYFLNQTYAVVPAHSKRLYMSTEKIYGDTSNTDVTYQAAVGVDPATAWYWIIDGTKLNGDNFDTSDGMWVDVTYGVVYESRKNITG